MVVIRFRSNARLDPLKLVNVVGGWPGATLVPPVSIKLDVEAPMTHAAPPPPSTSKRSDKTRRGEDPTASWWTARATAGEVKPGFSKEQILRKPQSDPRAEGGMFSRLAGLLQALGPQGQSF
jgi:hypothetical protein